MSPTEIKESLKELKLKGMLATFDSRIYEHTEAKQNLTETLSLLLQDEIDLRKSQKHDRQFKSSSLLEKTALSDFDWSFNPKVPKAMVMKLFDLQFIKNGEDALLLGASGTGKSHIAKALVNKICYTSEYKVIYREAHRLFEDLFEARQLKKHKKTHKQVVQVDLLIIDDLFLRKRIPAESADDLQEIIMDRYAIKKSTLITSNRVIEDWGKCLGDNAVASAILDRLIHRGHLIQFEGKKL